MADVFEEVEEELRADRWKTLAKRFAPWILLGLLIGGLVAGGVYLWREHQRKGAEVASLAYADGLEQLGRGDAKTAELRFRTAADGRSPVYTSLALMQIGGIRVEAGDAKGAATLFDQAAEAAPAAILEDSARLKAVFARMDVQPYADSIKQLTPLAEEGRPYRLLALEALALAKIGAGQASQARGDLSGLSLAADAPEGLRTRAQALLQLIDSGAAASLPAVAKAATTLPAQPPAAAAPLALPPGAQ